MVSWFRIGIVGLLLAAMVSWPAPALPPGAEAVPASSGRGQTPEGLAAALGSPDPLVEHAAAGKLAAMGDRAVPALSRVAGSSAGLAVRLPAVELLGKIGTLAARTALVDLLRREKDLAVRGAICMQLGALAEPAAVPVIAEHLATIGPRALNDRGRRKESQPSTCYIRHIEALATIGDERGIAVIEQFARKIPQRIGTGGFITNFVTGAVNQALADLKDLAAFRRAVRRHAGLEAAIRPLWEHFRTDRVARFELHADQVIGVTPGGRSVLAALALDTRQTLRVSGAPASAPEGPAARQGLAAGKDARQGLAGSAKALLAVYDRLEVKP